MKRIVLLLLLFGFASANAQYSEFYELKTPTKAKKVKSAEMGKRYLKLGNSYREIKDYDNAYKYLRKGYLIVSKKKDTYWTAVAYEYFAYFYRDLEQTKRSLLCARKAMVLYAKVVTQDDGSPYVMSEQLRQLLEAAGLADVYDEVD